MKTCKIEWYDDFNTSSWKLAALEYGVSIEETEKIGAHEVVLAVQGPSRNVKEFVEDVESGDVRPMCLNRGMDEAEYKAWLAKSIKKTA